MTHTSTEQPEALLPCPFCGKEPTLTKHHKEDAWGLTHRCEVIGPISFSWGSRELHIERWNRRTPASQAQRVPLTNEECDRLISALCPDFCDQRFPGDRPTMRKLARGALHSGITQEK